MTDTMPEWEKAVIEAVARALCRQDASTNPYLHEEVWPIYERDAQAVWTAAKQVLARQGLAIVSERSWDIKETDERD